MIYAEISVGYSHIEELDDALPRAMFDREAMTYEAAFLAGNRFWLTDDEAERDDRRSRIFSSEPMLPSPVIRS